MIPFLIITLAASLGANAALAYAIAVRRATRRPANARPKQRTGNAGRGPARNHGQQRAPGACQTLPARPSKVPPTPPPTGSRSPHADIPTEIRPRIERSPLARRTHV